MFQPVNTPVKLGKISADKGRASGWHSIWNVLLLEFQTNLHGSFLLQIQNKYNFFKKERIFCSCFFFPVMRVMKWSLFLWDCKAYRSQSYVTYIAERSANPVQPQSCLAQGWGSGNWKLDTEGIPNTVLKLKTALSTWHVLHESQGLYSFMLSDFLALRCWWKNRRRKHLHQLSP